MLLFFSLEDDHHYDHKIEQIVGYTLAAAIAVGVVAIIIRCHWLHRRKYACCWLFIINCTLYSCVPI